MINMKEVDSTSTVSENNSDISSQILSLTELYKSGALTKVEFDKAMKNILNQKFNKEPDNNLKLHY